MKITIAAARTNRHMTQVEVAKALGVSAASYNKFEQHPGEMRTKHLLKLSRILDVDPESLFLEPDSTLSGKAEG